MTSSFRQRWRSPMVIILSIVWIISLIFAACNGAVSITLPEMWSVLSSKIGIVTSEQAHPFEAIIWELRLPRALAGGLVGATLAVSGVLMQGLFRNPLAEPGLIGVSAGAAMGAVLVVVLAGSFFPDTEWMRDLRLLPLASFAGALLVTLAIQRVASSGGYTSVATLLLAGVAMNAVVAALIGLSTFLASDAQLRTLSFWTQGSLGAIDWKTLSWMTPMCLLLLITAPLFASTLNAMALGEAEAGHLGFRVERVKIVLVLLSAAAVGASVAFTGMIAFVGLIVPHTVRALVGPDHRHLLMGAAALGGIVMIAADTIARTWVAPAELPIGVLTALIGGPFFMAMLLGSRRRVLWG